MQPLVSVIMPAYNGEKYIEKAINSIMRQTYSNWELIIIEDGSSDNTLEIARRYQNEKIKVYVNEKNKGIAFSTNYGITHSEGKYIALLDDDDIATPKRLALQVDFLEQNTDIDILGGRSIYIDSTGKFLGIDAEPLHNPNLIKAYLLFYNEKFSNCTAMIRREFIEKNMLYYEEGCLGMQDFKFYIESSKLGKMTAIKEVLHLKRIHDEEETIIRIKNNAKERAMLFSEFQRESIEKSGFCLKEEQLQIINKVVSESVKEKKYTKKDVRQLYDVFAEMIRQGKEMKIDYLFELEYACRRIICDRVLRYVDIWNE